MMTLAKVSGGEAAASYYESADDYYSEDGHAPSSWWGAGADALGLSGAVNSAAFKTLLDGELPDGTVLQGGADGRRAGTDLTFSAPKSVSMQALIGGDRRLIDAHELAVSRALTYAQTRLAAYRLTVEGETHEVPSHNLLVARFLHDLSRDCDPQLHTHCVMVNATQTSMGEWRALDISAFYQQQKLMGALYRAELALEVQKLGYAVRLTHHDGRFELGHISDQHVAAFSSRSQAILGALEKRGKDRDTASPREKQLAGLSTRARKHDTDRTALHQGWLDKSAALGIVYAPEAAPLLTTGERAQALQAALSYAIAHTTERQSIVSHASLIGIALAQATGVATLADIEQALASRVQTGELLKEGERYTTASAQARERSMLSIEQRGRMAVAAISQPLNVLCSLANSPLNDGQRAAAQCILTTRNQVVGVQGVAGAGKTTMLQAVQQQAQQCGWQVKGIAPSSAAARELGKAGIESATIASFLERASKGLTAQTLLVVDEAGMVPAVDMLAILQAVEKAGAHLVLVGDTQQLEAVQAGRPFAQLQAAAMQTVVMDEILRQSNPTLKAAVAHAANGEVSASLTLLAPRIAQIDHAVERHARIARDYVALTPDERKKTLVVAGTNQARAAINAQVRQRLGLVETGVTVTLLERRDLTQAQLKSSLSYRPGDVIEMQAHYDSLGMTRGMRATVVEAEAGRVTLERDDGERVEWRPALLSKVAVYQTAERELAVGDSVRFIANNYALGFINGDRGDIVAIDRERAVLTIDKAGGGQVTLDTTRALQLDYGYCSTVHAAQGQTCERVLIDADAASAVTNAALYYVSISRARSEVQIYTDDRSLLPQAMGRREEKQTALALTS